MHHRVVFVAQAQVQCQIRGDAELILRIALIERPPAADHALALQIGRGVRHIVDEVFVRCVA